MPENLPINLYLNENEDDLPPTFALEGNEEIKLEPKKTINERVEWNRRKR